MTNQTILAGDALPTGEGSFGGATQALLYGLAREVRASMAQIAANAVAAVRVAVQPEPIGDRDEA